VYDEKYDADYINETANTASSIYFVNLVVMQIFNLLATRTRHLSIFQQPPVFNKATQVSSLLLSFYARPRYSHVTELSPLPQHDLRHRCRLHLLLYSFTASYDCDPRSSCRILVLASVVWPGFAYAR
jgi:hypothetical protein